MFCHPKTLQSSLYPSQVILSDKTVQIAAAIAFPQVTVSAVPPRSPVRNLGSVKTASIAVMIPCAASECPRCSSIIAPDQICPMGLAMPFPAISGAEPCTGSNNEGNFRSGLILPDGAMPIVPVQAGPKSDRISPIKQAEPLLYRSRLQRLA